MKTVVSLAALLAGLLFIEHAAQPASTDASQTHRPLLTQAEQENLQLTGLAITIDGKHHEYRRTSGTWRCLTAYGAIAHPRRIADLTRALLTSPAARRAPATANSNASSFGFENPIRIEFLRDKPAAAPLVFLLGASIDAPNGASIFVRREGLNGIWELDAEHLTILSARQNNGLPPLLDQRLTAGCLLDPTRGITRAFIDHESGASLELQPESSNGTTRWILTQGTVRTELIPYRFAGWLKYLQRAPYAGFTNPRSAEERGLEPPAARVTLFPSDAPPIELILGREVDGQVYVHNRTSGMLLLLPPNAPALIAPEARALTSAEGENPWEAWLR
jgi:hypothetical protein